MDCWTLADVSPADTAEDPAAAEPDGRFVLHRHTDAAGPHLDLRLEHGNALVGWRIDGPAFEAGACATPKLPHQAHWLDHDGDAIREDAGRYRMVHRDADRAELLLESNGAKRRVMLRREAGISPAAARDAARAIRDAGLPLHHAAGLVRDGIAARRRAIGRLCGLGRELDGDAFDERLARKSAESLSLEDIHRQLRAYEVRFDARYPPAPTSEPEALDRDDAETHTRALTILRDA
jgi:hypothetical protein